MIIYPCHSNQHTTNIDVNYYKQKILIKSFSKTSTWFILYVNVINGRIMHILIYFISSKSSKDFMMNFNSVQINWEIVRIIFFELMFNLKIFSVSLYFNDLFEIDFFLSCRLNKIESIFFSTSDPPSIGLSRISIFQSEIDLLYCRMSNSSLHWYKYSIDFFYENL